MSSQLGNFQLGAAQLGAVDAAVTPPSPGSGSGAAFAGSYFFFVELPLLIAGLTLGAAEGTNE